LAIKFVDFLLRPEVQQKFAEKTGYAPTNKTVQLSEGLQKVMPYGEEAVGSLIRLNSEVVNANKAAWTEEWNKMISR
jgi:putative spermidine/putrescine transport system substrate-binding protein